MKPDIYRVRNNSHPTTALATWMSLAKLGRNSTAKLAQVAENTLSSAMRGSVRLASARMISDVVCIDAQVIADGELRGEWTFNLTTDGTIEVMP